MVTIRVCIAMFASVFAVLAQSGCDKHAQDRQAIHHVMSKLVDARQGGDGDTYAELIASDNLDYYNRTLKLALTGKKADIMSLPFHQRYEILLVRLLGKKKDLKDLDAKGFIAWTIKNGLHEYMPGPDADLDLGHMAFRKDEAYLDLVVRTERRVRIRRLGTTTVEDESPTPFTLRFALEGGQWKFDQTTFNKALDDQIQVEIQRAEVDEDRALLYLLKLNTSQDAPPTIWNTMLH